MEIATLVRLLLQAEEHVAKGEICLMRQRGIVAQLGRGGYRTAAAMDLLEQFETAQNILIADRDRIKRQLAEISE
jgi:hypothetical protein